MTKRHLGPVAEAVIAFLRSIGAKVTSIIHKACITIEWRHSGRHHSTRLKRTGTAERAIADIRSTLRLVGAA